MNIRTALGRAGIVLVAAATVAVGQTNLVGRWDLMKGPIIHQGMMRGYTRVGPEKMELLGDKTGIVDGAAVTYKTQSGRFYLIPQSGLFKAASFSYTQSGPKLTLINDDNDTLKYLKKGHTLNERDVKMFLDGDDKTPPTVPNSAGSVKIGNLTWTKQNINIKTPNSWCNDDKESNCTKYGRLYTWEAAKNVCESMVGKWRLPTNDDWNNLMKAAGGGKGS